MHLEAVVRLVHSASVEPRSQLAKALERAREATEAILAPLSDDALATEVSPLEPSPARTLADVAAFEELWLLEILGGHPAIPGHDDVREALRHEPSGRRPRPPAVRAYAEDVRARVLDELERLDLDAPHALLREHFVFGLVLQHELQQQEALLRAIQLRTDAEYPVPDDVPVDRAPGGPDEIVVPEGVFLAGATDEPWAYDNELPAHEVETKAFVIDRAPVTNGQFAEFVDDRGYRSRRHWSDEGWAWREQEEAKAPLYWERGHDGWKRVRFGRREPLPLDQPVQHVCFHEAEAYAHWAGKRLPTELEWERAASWHEHRGKLRYPWGREWMGFEANLDRRRFSPAPAGSYDGGVSPVGCVQMAGDVWEWTSSWFGPYPGFLAFPYPELSEAYFGRAYRVLRGGSWATDALLARTSFRCFDEPGRRHLFAGFRCARDAS